MQVAVESDLGSVDAKRATLRDERANSGNAIYGPDGHKRSVGPYWHGGEREETAYDETL